MVHTFRMAPRKLVRLCEVMPLVGLVGLASGISIIVSTASSTKGQVIGLALGVLLLLIGLVFVVLGPLMLRFRVVVGDDKTLTAYNVKGGARRARGEEIDAIDLGAKPWAFLFGQSVTVRVPYVRLKDGAGFWLDSLAGTAAALPPRPEQLTILREMRELLGVGGADD